MERRILHIDMDAFFASVEQVLDPSLKGKPLIIGGAHGDNRGVVSTASYEARKFGVHSAMPLIQAKRLCPHGIFIRGNYENYRQASEKILEILETVSPLVEMASIDEAYLDISGSQRLFGGDDAIAHYIKSTIHQRTQLPCTIGIAPNKLVSKIAANEAKPNGYLRIPNGQEAAYLHPLPIQKLPGAGPKTCEILQSINIHTIGQLADLSRDQLLRTFGPMGYGLQRAARGISTSEVAQGSIPKSISRETTFPEDILDWTHIENILAYLTERAAHNLRAKGLETQCITLKVRYADFQTNTFAQSLNESTTLDTHIWEALQTLIPKAKQRHARIRLIGVALTSLTYDQHQLLLFGRERLEKWSRALQSIDSIRDRHGFELLRFGRSIQLGKNVGLATPSLSQ